MKRLNKVFLLCSVLFFVLFTSCEQENIGTKYDNKEGLTFSNSSLTDKTVQATNPKLTVDLYRSDGSIATSGAITFKAILPDKSELSGVTVSDYSFAEGETKTVITVDVTPLTIGVVLTMELTLPEEITSVGGISETTFKVKKAYTWQSIGQGKYLDNWTSGVEYPVDIQKAEGFDRYRVINPYVETMKNDDGDWGDWIATSSAPYVEFWTTENNLVSFASFFIGVNYEADSKQPIYAYHSSSFQNLSPDFSKWVDAKTVQLAPYYYITGLGGWNNTQKNNIIIITLP
ncbi:MAG: hypothetical protein ACK5KP_07215 [Paludibacteraceae bacterium]